MSEPSLDRKLEVAENLLHHLRRRKPLYTPNDVMLGLEGLDEARRILRGERPGRRDIVKREEAMPEPSTEEKLEGVWSAHVGEIDRSKLEGKADTALRDAVAEAWRDLFGESPSFQFTGFGSPLPERERAVVEDREPRLMVQFAEVYRELAILQGQLATLEPAQMQRHSGAGELSLADHIDYIRRHVGQGDAPPDWQPNDFIALVLVKLGQAVEALNAEEEPMNERERHQRAMMSEMGVEHMLTACAVLMDCVTRERSKISSGHAPVEDPFST
jgi:hypothetical protein